MGENLALKLLQSKKLRILATNLQTKYGEIDILAKDGSTLVIVEVKTKTNFSRGSAIEMITPVKQRKLILLAHELMSKSKSDNFRIDVVTADNASDRPVLKHHRGIVEFNG